MNTITLSLDETSYTIHRKVPNKSALYRWALWQWHKGVEDAEEAASALQAAKRLPTRDRTVSGRQRPVRAK